MPKIAPTSPLYAQFRADFPAQAGQGIPGDLNYSDTIVPIVDMTAAAGEGQLPTDLQTAWDFSTGSYQNTTNTYTTIINNTGFWLIDLTYAGLALQDTSSRLLATIDIYDGSTSKPVWGASNSIGGAAKDFAYVVEQKFVVYLRSGDTLRGRAQSSDNTLDVWYRQIADLNGNLTNPLGFTFN